MAGIANSASKNTGPYAFLTLGLFFFGNLTKSLKFVYSSPSFMSNTSHDKHMYGIVYLFVSCFVTCILHFLYVNCIAFYLDFLKKDYVYVFNLF